MRWFILLIYCIFLNDLFSQERPVISFLDSYVEVQPGTTYKNTLYIHNTTGLPQTFNFRGSAEQTQYTLLDAPASIVLQAGEKKSLPLKYFADENFLINSRIIQYDYTMTDGRVYVEDKISFRIEVLDQELIWLNLQNDHIMVMPGDHMQELQLLIGNGSINSKSFRLQVLNKPEDIQIDIPETDIVLAGKENRLIRVRIGNYNQSRNMGRTFQMAFVASDLESGQSLASVQAKISILSNIHRFNSTTLEPVTDSFIELVYNQNSKWLQYSQVRLKYRQALGKGDVSISTTGEYYHQQKGWNIYDTYLRYERPHLTVDLGNLSGENVDFNLSGRGAQIAYHINDSSTIQLTAVDNNFQLYSSIYRPLTSAKSLGLIYKWRHKKLERSRFSVIYSRDLMWNLQTGIASFDAALKLSSLQSISFEGGLSSELYKEYGQRIGGFGGGLQYKTFVKGFYIFSDNYYSTSNYSGYRRGSLLLNERISKQIAKNKSVYASFNYARSNPRYHRYNFYFMEKEKRKQQINYWDTDFLWQIDDIQLYPTFYNSETSVFFGISAEKLPFSLNLEPRYQTEERNSDKLYRMSSLRLGTNMSFQKNNHGLFLQANFGRSENKINNQRFNSMRTTLGYQWMGFGINGTIQLNPYFIGDLERLRPDKKFYNLSIRPHYNFSTFNNKLQGQASFSLDYLNTYESWMKFAEGDFLYTINRHWGLTGSLRYTRIRQKVLGHNMDNLQFRVGVRKNINAANEKGNYTVEITVFEDKDNDGIFSAADSPGPNVAVKLGEYTALSDVRGKLKFNNVPSGQYSVEVNAQGKWRNLENSTLIVKKNMKIQIPLLRNQRVAGRLIEKKSSYVEEKFDLQGIKVFCKDRNGTVRIGYTDDMGMFHFDLSAGVYTLYIENKNLTVQEAIKTVTVEEGHDVSDVEFEFERADIDIEVQKF